MMDYPPIDALESRARRITDILREDFNWNDDGFIDGLAPLTRQAGKPAWKARLAFRKKLIGASNGRSLALDTLIRPGDFLKFRNEQGPDAGSLDFLNWRGTIVREASYGDERQGLVLGRWVCHVAFELKGFDCLVDIVDTGVRVRLPSIVFFGTPWINYVSQEQADLR